MRVPTYDEFQAQQGGLPDVHATMPQGPNAAQLMGQQLNDAGTAISRAGATAVAVANDIQERANNQSARELDIDATMKLDAIQFAPDQGFMAKRGGDAPAALNDYTNAARKVRDDVLATAPNPAVKDIANRIITDRTMAAINSMNRHAFTENQKYQVQTSDDRAKVSLQAGASDYANEGAFQANLGTALHEAQAQGGMLGWDASTTKLQAQKYIDEAYRLRYEAWRLQDPVNAFANFQQNSGAISPPLRVQLAHQLFEASAPSLALQVNATGGAGVVQPAKPGDALEPRGIRNNNPGNIVQSSTPWQGEVRGNDPRFVSFESPEAGIRAAGKLLLTYQDTYGLNTVNGIVSRWAPATEAGNNPTAYAQQVATALKVKPDQPLDLHDQEQLAGLVKAMIKVENGKQPYTDQQIAAGLSAVKGDLRQAGAGRGLVNPPDAIPQVSEPTQGPPATANAWRDPSIPTGIPLVDTLPADWKMHVLTLAHGQAQQDMANARETLRAQVQDASAAYMTTGFAPNPPTLPDFIRAYGQVEGPGQFQQFRNIAQLGAQLQQVKTQSNAALDNLLQQTKPVPGPGFAAAQHNYEILTQAVEHTQKARQADPVGYAVGIGAYKLQPLSLAGDPQALGPQIAQRADAALQMASDYSTAPALLSRDEARWLSDKLKAAPVEEQKQYLKAIAQGAGSMPILKATMQSIAPDQPVLALAGIYGARGNRTDAARDTADLLLRGQAILSPNKKTDGTGHEGGTSLVKMPPASTLLYAFNSATGDAFAGKEQAADLFMQASRAIYAAKSAEAGDYSGNFDDSRWKSAINLATGGITQHNGASIVMPYGMGYDVFQARLKAMAPALAAEAVNVQPDELRRLPLENVGDGMYLFKRGTGYLVAKNGRPVVVNLNTQ